MKALRQARKERLAQRMSTVPRKVTQGDTLYDRLTDLSNILSTCKDGFLYALGRVEIHYPELDRDEFDILTLDETIKELNNVANEVKQVALDTHGGTTSPTDIGNWLY